jgi:hypothetical protein
VPHVTPRVGLVTCSRVKTSFSISDYLRRVDSLGSLGGQGSQGSQGSLGSLKVVKI